MALTEEEKKELVQDVVNQIKTDSQSVDELEAVSTLDGVVSLPAMRGETVVSAPLKLLSKPAEDAAAVAKASAAVAAASAKKADTATATAKTAAQTANDAAGKATDAAQKTNAAVAKAESVESRYKDTALSARNGATARFDGLVEGVEILHVSYEKVDAVVYDTVKKAFRGVVGLNRYCNNWMGADMYMNDARTEVLKDKTYVCGGVVYVWSDEEENLVEISGSGGGNTYNVTEQVPLESGYYTLETAIAAVEGKARAKGRCITYETAQGKWETKQFKGTNIESWEQAASWEDFGGDGTVKSVTLNGKKLEPGEDGNVAITISETEVDESLNVSSTNPVQNAAVTAKLMEIEASTVLGMNAELSDDGSSVRLALTNKSGAEIASADIPAGSGGGGGDASTTKIVLDAAVSKTIIKEGDSAMLTWTYDHQYSSGDEKGTSTGQKATVSIEMKRGATVMYADTQHDVSKGTYTLDLTKYLLLQAEPTNIRITSESADVEVRNLRVYNRALGDDEELANYMVDRPTSDEMVVLFEKNQVMDDEGTDVDIDKLRAMGKSVMRIVGDVNLVNQTNNKKFEVPVDIYFYSAYGKEYDFIIYQCGLRIQGTSSTTYPRKNYRIYFSRSTKYGTKLYVNGVEVADFKYSFKPGARPIDIFCLKADFSDSSSTHNTGAVRVVNDIWKRCGWLTPPQMAYKGNYDVRIGVDGFPIDLFYDNNGTGENVYLGKYNFNNEKSGSGIIYGFEGIEGFNDEAALKGGRNKCICLEFLNNSETLCLFGTSNMDTFDDALEFRFKADDTWATAHEDDKAAVKRLWEWIYSCKGNPTKFLNEYAEYFGNDSPFAWYLITDYFMAVDNRAKNMMLVTWDGKIWYFIPYDMDTVFGERNDSVLKYDYTITWETMDESIGSYAFAGHDSVLWELVRGCPDKLREVADKLRSTMSLEYVLKVFNEEMMGNWCERIYNKDGIYKYIKPLTEGVTTADGTTSYYDYLYALQGSRYAHRTYTIQNRFALLDSQYVCGTYRKDSFAAYFGYKFGSDNRKIRITASERYFFGYGYTSGTPHESAVLAEDTGSQVELTLDTDLIVNDPQYIYGASRIMGLDLTDVSHAILQTLNLNNCSALRTLDVSCGQTQTTLNALLVNGCRNLRTLNMTGLKSGSFTGIDLSNNTKLETLKAGKTALTGVNFAQGAPLTSVTLPATLQTLELRYLGKLTTGGLTLEGTSNINRLVVDNCPGVDWQTLHARCGNVKYLRVTGIDMEGDGSLLASLMQTGGVDENGGNVESCRLVGTYRLTRYVDDETYAAYVEHYPELNIEQPEYTMLESDESVADDANLSNLDNGTGYKYGNDYKPSGHVAAILKNRHRVLAKVTKKATTRNVNIANVDTVVNNLDGEMTYLELDDKDSTKYADGTPAKLDGSEGDLMMHEPFFWSKGINDFLNSKDYSCYSSKDKDHMPAVPNVDVLTLDDIKAVQGGYTKGRKVMSGRDTITNAMSTDSSYSVCVVDVSKHKRVRWPSVPGTNLVGSAFADVNGNVVKSVVVPTLGNRFEAGMYLISDVPEGAKTLYFSILNTAEFDKVVLSNSSKIEDMEPEWFANDEHLCAVVGSSVVGSKLRACITGGSTTASMTWTDFHYYSVQRGMQQIDALMHFRIANLAYAKYGRRNMQEQCGAGSHTNMRTTGGTMSRGMQDTIGYEGAKTINPNVTNSLVDENRVHQYAWYIDKDEYGAAKVTQVNNICCLGYEDIYGHKYDMMDGVDLPNTSGNEGKWRIWMPDGSTIMIKGTTNSGNWITAVAHGRLMAVVPVGSMNGSSSTYYSDMYWISTATGRVVYRGCNNAYASGGVSSANASDDDSDASTYVGSRLEIKIYRRTTMRTRSSMWCRGKRATATASMKGRKAETSSVGQ